MSNARHLSGFIAIPIMVFLALIVDCVASSRTAETKVPAAVVFSERLEGTDFRVYAKSPYSVSEMSRTRNNVLEFRQEWTAGVCGFFIEAPAAVTLNGADVRVVVPSTFWRSESSLPVTELEVEENSRVGEICRYTLSVRPYSEYSVDWMSAGVVNGCGLGFLVCRSLFRVFPCVAFFLALSFALRCD